jgi:hypothetical protein
MNRMKDTERRVVGEGARLKARQMAIFEDLLYGRMSVRKLLGQVDTNASAR